LAPPLIQRTEGLLRRDRPNELVVIPRSLGFRRLLDLEEVHVVHLATVDADATLADERIVGRHFLHLCVDLVAGLIRSECVDSLEVMHDARIEARLRHRRTAVPEAVTPTLRPCAGFLVPVPVECAGELQALSGFEAEAVDVRDEYEKPREFL